MKRALCECCSNRLYGKCDKVCAGEKRRSRSIVCQRTPRPTLLTMGRPFDSQSARHPSLVFFFAAMDSGSVDARLIVGLLLTSPLKGWS